MGTDGIHLASLLPSGTKRWSAIFVFAVLGVAGAVGYTIWRAPVYRAEARLYFKPSTDNPLSALANIPIVGTSGNDDLNDTAGLLETFSVKSWVQKALGLEKIDDVDKVIRYEAHPEYNQIILAAEDESKDFGLKAVTEAHKALKSVSQRTGFSVANDKMHSLEKALADNKRLLHEAERRSAAFEKQRKAPSKPDDPGSAGDYLQQAKQAEIQLQGINTQLQERLNVIKRSGQNPAIPSGLKVTEIWMGRLQDLEYQLSTARLTQGESSPAVQRLRGQINTAQKQYASDLKTYMSSVSQGLDAEIAALTVQQRVLEAQYKRYYELSQLAPDEAITSSGLAYEVKTRAGVVDTLTLQYEVAKSDAEVAAQKWALIDAPHVFAEPVNKKLGRMGAMGLMIGLAIGLFWPIKDRKKSTDYATEA